MALNTIFRYLSLLALPAVLIGCFDDEPRVRSAKMCAQGSQREALSVMTYNVHLFEIAGAATRVPFLREAIGDTIEFFLGDGNPVDFLDRERAMLIAERILEMEKAPDILVFTEVWNIDIAHDLIKMLASKYKNHFFPDADDDIFEGKALGSGLILLSRFPLYEESAQFIRFEKLGGDDAFATKGVAHVTVQVCDGPRTTVFMAHTQATEKDENGNVDETNTLHNIKQIGDVIRVHKEVNPDDAIVIAGDLNIAESSPSYNEMMRDLSAIDALRDYYPYDVPAFTYDEATNKLIKLFYNGEKDEPLRMRLDYILYDRGGPLKRAKHVSDESFNAYFRFEHPTTGEVLPLSDHYPVLIEFETATNIR